MSKRLQIAVILSLTITLAYGQNSDTIQPDSLYRKLKVHSRSSFYVGSPSKSKEIFIFNEEGKYAGFILTDNETGNTPQMKMIYHYNDKGVLSAEEDTAFRGRDYAVKTADFLYDTDGQVLKKTIKNGGKIISEITFNRKDNYEIEKLYRSGAVYREQTSYYDDHHKKIRFTGIELADKNAQAKVIEVNGKKFTINPPKEDSKWDYTFENTYDLKGNLIAQKRTSDGKVQDEVNYLYDNKGLLKEEKDIRFNHPQIIKFEYDYY